MNKRRVIFFTIFGVYHLIIFIFTSYIDVQKQDLGVLTRMYGALLLFKYGAILGLLLFVTDFIWSWRFTKSVEKEQEALKFEINNLKAKVYDLQEASKPLPVPDPPKEAK
jgi:ABC-type transport system involved in cytochrome bd biosynthesis fused ATPase/permease subunit